MNRMFAWQLSVSSVLLLIFQCRVTVMWRLQTGFLCRRTLPLTESPAYTLTGLSSMNRVCFQCVGLRREKGLLNTDVHCSFRLLQIVIFKSITLLFAACNTQRCTQILVMKSKVFVNHSLI